MNDSTCPLEEEVRENPPKMLMHNRATTMRIMTLLDLLAILSNVISEDVAMVLQVHGQHDVTCDKILTTTVAVDRMKQPDDGYSAVEKGLA